MKPFRTEVVEKRETPERKRRLGSVEEKPPGQKSEQGLGRGEGDKYRNIERNVFKHSKVERKIDFHHKTMSRQDQHVWLIRKEVNMFSRIEISKEFLSVKWKEKQH